ncbi:MAG: SF1B family DNA helicase RecD2 [Planctomycetota bacterium]
MSDTLPFDTDEQPIALRGTLVSITFRNEDNGYTVARVELDDEPKPVTAVGCMPGVVEGDTLALSGRWIEHPSYGRQLEVERCELRLPSGRSGLVKFLGGGRIHGVGPKTAERIVDALGLDVLDRLERNPELLATVPGVSHAKAHAIMEQLAEQRAAAAAFVFLQEHGLGPGQAQRVFRAYGEHTVERVRENPWRLADEVWGIGFRTADTLARSLGHEADSSFRVAAGLRYLLSRAAVEGHVGLPLESLAERGAPFLDVEPRLVEHVLVEQLRAGELIEDGLIYLPELHAAERDVAEDVRRLLGHAHGHAGPDAREPLVDLAPEAAVRYAEQRTHLELAADQRHALSVVLGARVSVLTGGPGVGKTTIIRCLLDVLDSQGLRVALAAPTGRAARRLGQATHAEASTLHRLLGIQPSGATFTRARPEPLDLDVLIVDETSMVDIALMASVVSALPASAGLVLVGDVDQLPSVGPGAVLRAFIESGVVPVARLTTIFRQAEHSGIVRVAHEINAGEQPRFDEGPAGQAFFVERADPAGALAAILQLVLERIPERFGLHPLRDVQVLTPMHGGPLGTVALNEALREALNPAAPERPELTRFGRMFRQGDKVMQVRNNYELNVFNGDIGQILSLDLEDGRVVVDYEGRHVGYSIDALAELEPAFAITCHKSQGSEFPAVVLPIVPAHHVMLRRNLVYTAFTRARRILVSVGSERALRSAVANADAGRRHSRLAERLAGEPAPG